MEVSDTSNGIPWDFLANLRCPFCGSRFNIESMDSRRNVVCFGVLTCSCYQYPVLVGIPILQQVAGLQQVVHLVRDSAHRAALLLALDLFRIKWAQQSKLHRLKYQWNCKQLVDGSCHSFSEAVKLVRRPRVFADYLVHRYANPSFLAAIGPISVLARTAVPLRAHAEGDEVSASVPANRPTRVLDLACGAGHASYLMSLLGSMSSVVSADQDFVNVYLASRFLVPGSIHLCIDAQAPSPLPDRYFDAVYCQDAFHYFQSKRAAIAEIKRVSHPDALWVFPHLHNRLCLNPVPGLPLSPTGYLECFDLAGARLFSESQLLRSLVAERVMDLREFGPAAELDDSPALTLIRGGSGTWSKYNDIQKSLCSHASALQVNPIYTVRHVGDDILLERSWPNNVIAKECAEANAFLVESCRLSANQVCQLENGWSGLPPEWVENLVAKFILVPLPDGYMRESAIRIGPQQEVA